MNIYKKNKVFGKYPSCDFLNMALQKLLKNPQLNKDVIEDICYAIYKSNGYFYEDNAKKITEYKIFYIDN